jgi:hypothetical protein
LHVGKENAGAFDCIQTGNLRDLLKLPALQNDNLNSMPEKLPRDREPSGPATYDDEIGLDIIQWEQPT